MGVGVLLGKVGAGEQGRAVGIVDVKAFKIPFKIAQRELLFNRLFELLNFLSLLGVDNNIDILTVK